MGLSDIVVYDSVMKSNIPVSEKSLMRKWFEKMTDIVPSDDTPSRGLTKDHVISAVQMFRQNLESNVVSAGLGAFHAEFGLDVGKVPLDAVSSAVLNLMSIGFAKHEISRDLLNMGTAAGNCFSFRKGYGWAAAKKIRQGNTPAATMGEVNIAGEDSDDPIIQAARSIKDK